MSITLVGAGLFVLFTLPALVAASDRRHAHDLFHAALAIAGLVWAWCSGGLHVVLLALASGALVLVLLASTVAITQRQWQRRPFTGGEIKFVTAAALWLQPIEALIAVIGACLAMILWSFARKSLTGHASRPDIAPFILITVLLSMAFRN